MVRGQEGSAMNTAERIKLVKAMEYIARNINDEEIFESWLMCGVADGDLEYGDLDVNPEDPDAMEYYIRDGEFADIMALFLRMMARANKSGGLYCDSVVSSGAKYPEGVNA